jgi:hypothetical protein
MARRKSNLRLLVAQVLVEPKWRPLVVLSASVPLGVFCWFTAGISASTLWVSNAILFSIGGGIVISVPPDVLSRSLRNRTNAFGVLTWVIALVIIRFANSYTGNEQFYTICATILPVLILTLVVDSRIFEAENSIHWIFFNLALIAGGEGGCFLAITEGNLSLGVFSYVSAAMIAAFVTIIASAATKIKMTSEQNVSLSALAKLALRTKLITPSMVNEVAHQPT